MSLASSIIRILCCGGSGENDDDSGESDIDDDGDFEHRSSDN